MCYRIKGRIVGHFLIDLLIVLSIYWLLSSASAEAQIRSQSLIIDHTCTDLTQIPATWIDSVQTKIRLHYAHTSHGGQLTTGLERLKDQNNKYSMAIGYSWLPTEAGALCIFDGQESETYITPDLYWDSETGRQNTQSVLNHNATINVSMWSWCTQQNDNDSATTQRYLETMAAFEAANPQVIFVYMTGNAQGANSNRQARNNQVRNFCRANNKVLYDFADLDCWYNGEQYFEEGIPTEHPHYNGDQAAHTTYESCENKGRAFWWLLARLAGWQGTLTATESETVIQQLPRDFTLLQNYPNPFNPTTTIRFALPKRSAVTLKLFGMLGREVSTLVDEELPPGEYQVVFDATSLATGVYFYHLQTEGFSQTRKLMLLK